MARPARRHATAGPSARSTQNRWSSVHTEPCHQIVTSTGAAAASASHAHGHDLRRPLAPTMPAARMPTANSAARSGADWITNTSRWETCGPTIPTIATTSVTAATIRIAPRRRTISSSSGSADAMSHWLASSITMRSKNPGSNGNRPRAESDVTAQHGRIFVTRGNRL